MSKNIVLVGFMGAGKSVVAKNLATALKRQVVSTDHLIEEKEKRPIADIFTDSGEAYFRTVEKAVVAEVSLKKDLIIDCGGGVILNQDNIENLKKAGILFYLATSPDVVYERVKSQRHRPLLNVPDPKRKIEELLTSRKAKYEQAHYTIDTSLKTVTQVVDEILKLISHE